MWKTYKNSEMQDSIEYDSKYVPSLSCALTVNKNGKKYTKQGMIDRYGYNWKTAADGAVWYFRSDDGEVIGIQQGV